MTSKQSREKAEFIDRMLTEVHQIPVADVVGSVVTLYHRGRYLMGLCPFHPDHNLGSFVVTPDKNLWRCFAEGIGGNAVKFVMEYDKLSYLDAAFKLAKDYNIITESEYVKYSGKRWDETVVRRIREKLEEPKQEIITKKAAPGVIAAVYAAIPEVCRLSDVHKKHLLSERMLKEESLKDYFTFPTRRMDLANKVFFQIAEKVSAKEFGKKLADLNEDERQYVSDKMQPVKEQIAYVPGFYDSGRIDFASYKGIGILARDETGRPTGIQIRRDTVKNGEKRYVWFSSAFAQPKSGASSGSPGGFLKGNGKRQLIITEGRFKAEQIASHGNDVIYLSGVSAWKSVIPMVKRVKGNRDRIFLAFDSDMLGNVAVHKQLAALQEELQNIGLRCCVLLWAKKNGKGFDDLVVNKGERYARYMKAKSYKDFDEIYQNVLKGLLTKYNAAEVRDVKSEQAEVFASDLQEAMEKALELPTD